MTRWEAFRRLPIAYRLSVPLRMLILPAGLALILFTDSTLPGLILVGLWVVDTAVVSPLILAYFRKRERQS